MLTLTTHAEIRLALNALSDMVERYAKNKATIQDLHAQIHMTLADLGRPDTPPSLERYLHIWRKAVSSHWNE